LALASAHDQAAVYQVGKSEVDLGQRILRSRGRPIPLGSRAFAIIEVLASAAGELVSKDEIIARVWPNAIVEENTLTVHVSAVRRALSADRGALITDSGRGYRLLGTWQAPQQDAKPSTLSPLQLTKRPAQPFLNNLPSATSELVGRDNPRRNLLGLLSAYRVVTVTGHAGMGKTALALDVARTLFPSFQGDAWVVELAPVMNPSLVTPVVARSLGVPTTSRDISPATIAQLMGTRKLLLVLDNCEHVIDPAARLAETLVRLCPNVTLLATSREILRIEGEHVFRLLPLDVPPTDEPDPDRILEYSSVRLFLDRLRALRSDFRPGENALTAIAAICRRLDGIPLAVELAAAHAATFGPEQLAAGIDDRFSLLTRGRRTSLPRHQTLRAALDWSYDLLTDSERQTLLSLAILIGPFSLQTVSEIATCEEEPAPVVLGSLDGLVAKSLIVAESQSVVVRFRLLETTRSYALGRLIESGQHDRVAARHARYFTKLLEDTELDWAGRPKAAFPTISDSEAGNLAIAIDWAFSATGDPRLGIGLTIAAIPHLLHLSLANECCLYASRALAVLETDPDHEPREEMELLTGRGLASLYTTPEAQGIRATLTCARAIADRLKDDRYRLRTCWGLCFSCLQDGDFLTARDLVDEFHELASMMDEPHAIMFADQWRGGILHVLGDQLKARQDTERLLSKSDISIDRRAVALSVLSAILWLQGRIGLSKQYWKESEQDAMSTSDPIVLCTILGGQGGNLQISCGDIEEANRTLKILRESATRYELGYWLLWADCFEGALLVKLGELEKGQETMGSIFSERPEVASHPRFAILRTLYAEALLRQGQTERALSFISAALDEAKRKGQWFILPEYLRVQGEAAANQGGPTAIDNALSSLREGLELARRQGSLVWQLRSAMSLARLSPEPSNRAFDDLAKAYAQFADGHDTDDLKAARTLLAARQSRNPAPG
jgi:predicted ATPase/DNA-binding winged helix-turn-helix (wHTH) protein